LEGRRAKELSKIGSSLRDLARRARKRSMLPIQSKPEEDSERLATNIVSLQKGNEGENASPESIIQDKTERRGA